MSSSRSGTGAPARSRMAAWTAPAMPFVLFLAISAAMVWWFSYNFPYVSPIDEAAHFDYVTDLPHVPALGEPLSQSTLRAVACRTTGELVFEYPPCDSERFDPDVFPGGGYSNTGATPPLYYAVTAVITRPIIDVTGWSQFRASRAVGALWLAGLMAVCYLLALRLGASRPAALGATVLTCSVAGVVSSGATVGPDVATALVGGVVMLAAVGYDGTRRRTLLLLCAVALAALTKFTAFTAVGAVAVSLVARVLLRRGRADPDPDASPLPSLGPSLGQSLGPSLAASVAACAVFVGVSLIWALRYTWTALVDAEDVPTNAMFMVEEVAWRDAAEWLAYAFLHPVTENWVAAFLGDYTNNLVQVVVAGVLALGLLAGACALRSDAEVAALGLGVLVLALVGPTLLMLLNFYANGLAFQIPPRYAYALVPGMVALSAWALRGPGPSRALVLLAAWSLVSVFT